MSREAKASRRNEEREEKKFFSLQPKQLFARLKQDEQFSLEIKRNSKGRSSKEERKVNALALRADEGRDNLR